MSIISGIIEESGSKNYVGIMLDNMGIIEGRLVPIL